MWETLFSLTNGLALLAWVALAFLPRWEALLSAILYIGVGILSLTYAVLVILTMSGQLDSGAIAGGGGGMDFSSIEGVRGIFMSDGGVVIGWTHYLAFDLFVGLWIARDADNKGVNRVLQVPVLFFTLMLGPLGLALWLIIREPAARRMNRRKGPNAPNAV